MARTSTEAAEPRSLADALRAYDDAGLATLVQQRPDLLTPVPSDIGQLAARAGTAASTMRALDRVDLFHLQVIEVLAVLPEPAAYADVRALMPGVAEKDVKAAIRNLRGLALVWGGDDGIHLVRAVREALGLTPTGLGPAMADSHLGVARLIADPSAVDLALAEAPEAARAAIERLTWGPPTGRVENATRHVDRDTARTPVDWLIAHGLLVAVDDSTVVLPREIALHLRGGRVHAEVFPRPPQPSGTRRDQAQVDRTAAGAAFSFVRLVEDLLETWSTDPPGVLRSGGLGVRELRKLASTLDVDEATAALVAETAYASGLLAPAGEIDDVWLPTPAYDLWRTRDTAQRWATVAETWLESTRVAGLVGQRDERDKAMAALGPDLDRPTAPDVRRGVLDSLAATEPGTALDAAAVSQVLRWHRPRRAGRFRDDLIRWTLREGEAIGVLGLGALSAHGRSLADGDGGKAAGLLEPLLPQPLDHVLLQADLTAVAPGPLTSELAHELGLMAEVESTGGATVFRFSETSVRRALDAGRSASELHALLARHSRTAVPQPLTYLVDDVARRHGRIRVGTASAYVRCDDPAVLDELVADRRSGQLRLRRIAPTVVAAQAPVDLTLERLRSMGYAPAAESPEGELLVRRPDSRRSPPRQRPPRLLAEPPVPSDTLVVAAVKAIRAGDRAANAPRGRTVAGPGSSLERLPRLATTETLAALRQAVEAGEALWIGYVDNHGGVSERVVDPIRVEGGYLTAYDHRLDEVHTFAVHRITGVASLTD